jgi:hypothetical protein
MHHHPAEQEISHLACVSHAWTSAPLLGLAPRPLVETVQPEADLLLLVPQGVQVGIVGSPLLPPGVHGVQPPGKWPSATPSGSWALRLKPLHTG